MFSELKKSQRYYVYSQSGHRILRYVGALWSPTDEDAIQRAKELYSKVTGPLVVGNAASNGPFDQGRINF